MLSFRIAQPPLLAIVRIKQIKTMTPNPHTLLKKCDSIQGPSRHSSAHHSMFYPFSFFSAYQQTCHLATFYQFILAHQVDAVWHPPEAANRTLSLGGLNMTSNISRMAAHQKKTDESRPNKRHNSEMSTSTISADQHRHSEGAIPPSLIASAWIYLVYQSSHIFR